MSIIGCLTLTPEENPTGGDRSEPIPELPGLYLFGYLTPSQAQTRSGAVTNRSGNLVSDRTYDGSKVLRDGLTRLRRFPLDGPYGRGSRVLGHKGVDLICHVRTCKRR